MFSLKQQSKGIINNCFARLNFLLFIHLLTLMFISYGRISVHMEVNGYYAMHHINIWDISTAVPFLNLKYYLAGDIGNTKYMYMYIL